MTVVAKPARVDLVGGGANSTSTPSARGERGVARLVARVGREVGGLVELRGVDEQRDDDLVALLARPRASAPGGRRGRRPSSARARRCGPRRVRAATWRGSRRWCGASSSGRRQLPGWRRRARRTASQQLGGALRDRLALAGDRRLVAAGDRAGQRALARRARPSCRPRRGRAGRAARAVDAGGGRERAPPRPRA